MPFFPCLASGRCRAGRSRVLRLLPMGRNLRVEPFCFARKKVSPMDAYSLLSFLGRTADGLGEQGTEPLPTAAAVGRRSAHSLRYLCSTSIARITDQSALTDGLRLAGSRQRFRPREAKLPEQFQSQRTSRRHCFGTEVSPMVTLSFALIIGRKRDETTARDLLT